MPSTISQDVVDELRETLVAIQKQLQGLEDRLVEELERRESEAVDDA